MYAVVQLGSFQYRVSEGDRIEVQRMETDPNKSIHLDKVLLYAKDQDVRIGTPYLKNVKVTATVLNQILDNKKLAFKFRRRKGSTKKRAHRQKLTVLAVTKIDAK